ncbi:MAG: amino acid ABC transporter permease [Neisseriaceae bacterium]|nr:amino acid ABC transporter permease [Neisseriaceae bacterium]
MALIELWYELCLNAWPVMLKGLSYTLFYAIASMLGGLALGLLIAIIRVAKVPMISFLASFYVSIIRGTPLLVQIFMIYYGITPVIRAISALYDLGLENFDISATSAGIAALSMNAAAYLSESLRGGINGISQGQWLAAQSLGFTWWQSMMRIILPQALRLAVPSMSNTLNSLIKDTSLLSVISVWELMMSAKEIISENMQPFPIYLMIGLMYWVISFVFERIQARIETRLEKAHTR